MKNLVLAMFLVAGPAFAGDLPDARMTPGAINSDVTQENIHQTVCVKGYTKTIRPPVEFTNRLKREQIREYGYANTDPRAYEEDHLVALSIGGAPNDRRNLWPQPRDGEWSAEKKDQLENIMLGMLCHGEVSLADAQREMAGNWIAAWRKYVPSHSHYLYGHAD